MQLTKTFLDKLTYKVIGCCISVHKELGPGLLESVYHKCLIEEFKYQNIHFDTELVVPIKYRDAQLQVELRSDFLIEKSMVLEIKAVNKILPVHQAQTMSYMKLLNVPKGILVNFNCVNIFEFGQQTFVNDLFKDLSE